VLDDLGLLAATSSGVGVAGSPWTVGSSRNRGSAFLRCRPTIRAFAIRRSTSLASRSTTGSNRWPNASMFVTYASTFWRSELEFSNRIASVSGS